MLLRQHASRRRERVTRLRHGVCGLVSSELILKTNTYQSFVGGCDEITIAKKNNLLLLFLFPFVLYSLFFMSVGFLSFLHSLRHEPFYTVILLFHYISRILPIFSSYQYCYCFLLLLSLFSPDFLLLLCQSAMETFSLKTLQEWHWCHRNYHWWGSEKRIWTKT